jgi:hypothetical protein
LVVDEKLHMEQFLVLQVVFVQQPEFHVFLDFFLLCPL